MTKDPMFYVSELRSDECQCGPNKKPGRSFCYGCYKALPKDIQKGLYRRIYDGYEQAYDEAVKFLSDESEIFTCPLCRQTGYHSVYGDFCTACANARNLK